MGKEYTGNYLREYYGLFNSANEKWFAGKLDDVVIEFENGSDSNKYNFEKYIYEDRKISSISISSNLIRFKDKTNLIIPIVKCIFEHYICKKYGKKISDLNWEELNELFYMMENIGLKEKLEKESSLYEFIREHKKNYNVFRLNNEEDRYKIGFGKRNFGKLVRNDNKLNLIKNMENMFDEKGKNKYIYKYEDEEIFFNNMIMEIEEKIEKTGNKKNIYIEYIFDVPIFIYNAFYEENWENAMIVDIEKSSLKQIWKYYIFNIIEHFNFEERSIKNIQCKCKNLESLYKVYCEEGDGTVMIYCCDCGYTGRKGSNEIEALRNYRVDYIEK